MKFLVVLCLVAAVAQAIDVNWTTVKAIDIFPEDIEILLENTSCYETPEPSDNFGAQIASLGQFPWQVGLIVTKAGETGFCGGSILSEEWILTAAHCVEFPDSIEVLFAARNLVDSNPEQYTRTASWSRQMFDYDPYFVEADIALLKLDEPITFNDYVRPIRLPRSSAADPKNEFAGSIGIVSGWGSDFPGDTTVHSVLHSYQNTILSWSECNAVWPRDVELAQVCLSTDNGRSTYKADSGSPLVVKEADGEYTQVGVLSYGSPSRCHSGLPVVYARVSSFVSWFNWVINDGPIPLPYTQQ